MRVKMIGMTDVRSGEFDGRRWSHRKLYVTYPDPNVADLTGEICEPMKIAPNIDVPGKPGDMLEITFGRRDRVESIRKIG